MNVLAVIAVLEFGLGYVLHHTSRHYQGADQTISIIAFGVAVGCEGCGAVTGVAALAVRCLY